MTKKPDILRIAVAQLNPTVGDVAGNLAKARAARSDAARQGADIVLFTELFLAGYPPEDLVLKPAFLKACEQAAEAFAGDTADGGPGVIIGTPLKRKSGTHNSIVVADGGKIIAERYKLDLPNYGEFDEKRVFQAGPEVQGPVNFRGVRLGIPICEDIWGEIGVCETLAESGAEILLVPNGSPYYRAKIDVRHQIVIKQVVECGLPMIYANQLGGQDELVFDGASFAIGADRMLAFQMSQFEEAVDVTTWRRKGDSWACSEGPMSKIPEREEADYRACMLGLRDYVNKNGFKNVVLGLSGGIDSAICTALAVDALGEERVRTVMMPYRYTSSDSLKDAEDCARALGCRYDIVPIFEPVEGFMHALTQLFEGTKEGITEENLQSRACGGRLRHPLWRHERWLQPDQGPLQDAGLRALTLAQRPRSARSAGAVRGSDPEEHHRQGAVGGTARKPDRPGFAAALSGAGRHPRMPGRERDGRRRDRRARP